MRFVIATRPAASKPHVDDVALGRRDDDAVDPLFALEVADVAGDELDARAAERDVVDPRVRRVRQEEAHDVAAPHVQRVPRLAVHEHDVAEAAHQRVRRRLAAVWNQRVVAEQQVVEHQHLLAIRPAVIVRAGRPHEHVAGEAEVLLDVLADVRVIPVEPGVGKAHAVGERVAGRDGILRDAGCAVEPVVEPHAVPVNRAGCVEPVS